MRIDLSRLLEVDPLSAEARQLPDYAVDGVFFARAIEEKGLSVAELVDYLNEIRWHPFRARRERSVHEESGLASMDWSTRWTRQKVYRRLDRAQRELKLAQWRCLECGELIRRGPYATGRPADYCPKHASRKMRSPETKRTRRRRRAELQRRLEL
jgi:hypothetical protein